MGLLFDMPAHCLERAATMTGQVPMAAVGLLAQASIVLFRWVSKVQVFPWVIGRATSHLIRAAFIFVLMATSSTY